jgi:cation diffusion facilitator CzcD-associated flavoprotein CzcO
MNSQVGGVGVVRVIKAPSVAIIGAGMSGLCMAAKLLDAGIDGFTIFEKADDVGGTWRDNNYPGLTCDVPSRFYSYTFRPNPNWSQFLSPGPEIHGYFRQVAAERGITGHIRFGADVTAARFEGGRWLVVTAEAVEACPRPFGSPVVPVGIWVPMACRSSSRGHPTGTPHCQASGSA